MKNIILKPIFFLLLVGCFNTTTTLAQPRGGRGGRSTPPPTTPPPTSGKATSQPPPKTGSSLDTAKPKTGSKTVYTVEQLQGDVNSSNEYGTDYKQSLKTSYGYTKNNISERRPLDYDHIREDDATFSHYVWREIDAREKINLPFLYKVKNEGGDQRFYSILLRAITKDSVMAFVDEGFTTPLTPEEIAGLTSRYNSKILDTSTTPNIDDPNIIDTIIKPRENQSIPKGDSVYKFKIKEQWIFDREASRLTVRIIGIAPMYKKERDVNMSTPFWIYYPDLRPTLARTFAYNPKNIGSQLSWEEVFEGRFFSSYIIKSTLNNPGDKTLAQLIKDPLFQLLEGENIKEKLFNYEQDLWSY